MTSDLELLKNYIRNRCEESFATLVNRHLNLVYSAALRQVRSPQLAEEVAQSTFTDLANQAHRLAPDTILTAWLYQVAHRTAINVVRREVRRQFREQIACELTAMNSAADWSHIEPLLDEAMLALDNSDRTAVLLRYFENKSLREVGQTLGISDDAAQKRVSRALERLRQHLANRGVTTTAVALSTALSTNAATVAPAGLSATLSSAALAGTTITAATAIAMTTLQKTIVIVALAAAVGTGIYEAHQVSTLRRQNKLLQEQQSPLTAQIQQLQHERDKATNRLVTLTDEIAKSKSNNAELLKLRGEVTKLRAEGQNLPAARAALLKQKLELMPHRKIPELQFATEKDWLDASWDEDLSTEDGVREALSKLREAAVNKFLNEMMQNAIQKYLAANDGILPADLSQLKPYFQAQVTDEMLQRYKLLQSGKPDNSADLVKLAVYADAEYDSEHAMRPNGAWGSRFNLVEDAVKTAAQAFASNNNGQMPSDASEIVPYLQKSIDAVTAQKYLNRMAADPSNGEIAILAPALKAYGEANGHGPADPADLSPYLTTPEQRATLQKMLQGMKPNETK